MPTPRVDSTATTTAARSTPADLLTGITNLSAEAWEFAVTQGRQGGGVSDAQPELFALYRQQLGLTKQKDSPALRAAFLSQLCDRLGLKAQDAFAETGMKPSWPEAVAAMKTWSAADEASFQKQLPQQNLQRTRRTDQFQRPTPTSTPRTQKEEPVSTVDEYYEQRAKTPDEAVSMRTDKLARDNALMGQLKTAVAAGKNPFTGTGGEVARRAYVDFLGRRGVVDSPSNRKLFVDLLAARSVKLASGNTKNLDATADKRLYAEAALQQLAARAQGTGNIDLNADERWMISALTDPGLTLSPDEQKVVDRLGFRDQGLRTSLADFAAKRKANADWRPPLGAGFKTMLNASTVFDGDPQKNAFTLAAQTGGYSQAEIDLAAKYLTDNGVGLYVDRDQAGEPLITDIDKAKSVNVGGQNFVPYTLGRNAAEALRDARYAVQQGYGSLADYRKDFDNTWSDKVNWLGSKYLELEQSRDKLLGLENNSVLGPLVRGKYDAMRELIQVGANGANLAQMAVSETNQFLKTGNPFVTIASNEELSRYFDNGAARVEQTFTELGRNYSQQEQGVIAQIARGTVAGLPKIAVNLIPGAAIYYNALKHANHDLNDFAKETAIDLASLVGGAALGRITSAGSTFASGFVNNTLAKATVNQVVSRGISAIGGATMNVALDMGPEYVKGLLRTDAETASMTDAQKKEVSEKLSMDAFKRNVFSGLVFGLVAPGKHQKDDLVLLSKPNAELEGPLFRTRTPEGTEHYYSAVKLEENGKSRIEFIEADAKNPRVAAAIKEGRVTEGRQPDIDLALAQSRYGRLDAKQRAELTTSANNYAAKKMLSDAETGVQLSQLSSTKSPLEQLSTSLDNRRELLRGMREVEKVDGKIVKDPVQSIELPKASPQKFLEAFGEGPYTPALMNLFKQPGFGDLVAKNPEAAGALYRANAHTDVIARIKATNEGLKTVVPPNELGARTLEATVKQLEAEGTTVVRKDGFVIIERNAALKNGRPFEMVLEDDAMRQQFPTVDADGKVKWQKSNEPVRVELDGKTQFADLDGKPIDQSRTGMIVTHGWTDGLTNITDAQMNAIAKRIVDGGDIDQIVLAACSQGDKRPQGATFAQKFWGDLNARVKTMSGGKKSIDVYASKEPGIVAAQGYTNGKVTLSIKDTSKPVQLVPVLRQGNLFDVPAEWSKAYQKSQEVKTPVPLDGNRALVYVIRVNEEK